MKLSEFDYDLPERCIAQQPLAGRDDSRLMLLERESGRVGHHRFSQLAELLRAGDLLVFNDTRVLPARLLGRKPTGARVELLLLERVRQSAAEEIWQALVKSSRSPAAGSRVIFPHGLSAELIERSGEIWKVRLLAEPGSSLEGLLEQVGVMPLPPYIKRPAAADDLTRYQTVYAARSGAVAAPTAGLHFTPELLAGLRDNGVETAFLTLHIGLGTFQPVREERVEDHRMHEERFDLSTDVAAAIERTRQRKGRVIGVGTSVVRTLEYRATDAGLVSPGSGRCDLFIRPGYRFRVVDAMVTNFHLPCSTLLMLVSAFAGRDRILGAYRTAIEKGYRFYSYGDAMLLS